MRAWNGRQSASRLRDGRQASFSNRFASDWSQPSCAMRRKCRAGSNRWRFNRYLSNEVAEMNDGVFPILMLFLGLAVGGLLGWCLTWFYAKAQTAQLVAWREADAEKIEWIQNAQQSWLDRRSHNPQVRRSSRLPGILSRVHSHVKSAFDQLSRYALQRRRERASREGERRPSRRLGAARAGSRTRMQSTTCWSILRTSQPSVARTASRPH